MTGADTWVEICPAGPDEGLVFERVDTNPPVRIPATVDYCVNRPRRTTLKMGDVEIETVEHCLSAVTGLGIDNAIIRVNGPEIPLGDGSAKPFVDPMLEAGTVTQDRPRKVFRLREAITVSDEDGSQISALPTDIEGMLVVYNLDYGRNAHRIRRQTYSFTSFTGEYARDVAPARTY